MAGGQERILKRRIKSVQATKKITRAMELIAGSRIVRAQQRVHAAVPYSDRITEVVKDLAAAGGEVRSPLLQGRGETKRVCFVALTADRGLCGGYNSGVIRATEGEIKEQATQGIDYSLVLVGRKAESYFRFRHYRIDATYSGFTDNPTYENARMVATRVLEMFEAGEVDRVELVYTRFASAGTQEVVQRPLVPLDRELMAGGDGKAGTHGDEGGGSGGSYEMEPDPTVILEALLPRYVEARVYAAMLNAAASEHAFRQRAMKAATDNAEDLITNLTRVMNRARQDSITTEIMEIVSGAEALSGGAELDPGDRLMPRGPSAAWLIDVGATGAVPAAGVVVGAVGAVGLMTRTATGDDSALERIEGIGPKIGVALRSAGIATFQQLSTASEAELRAALTTAGLAFAPSLGSWAQQAALLAAGDEAGFTALTDRLIAGRQPGNS
jgi:F-type H+-transporting ATPase subunit gamma